MKTKFALALVVLMVAMFATPAGATPVNYATTINGITFGLVVNGATGTLTINAGACNVANCLFMGDIAFKFVSSYTDLASSAGPSGYAGVTGGLNNSGCSGSGGGWVCFNTSSGHATSGGDYVFTVTLTGSSGVLDDATPSVKAIFYSQSTPIDGSTNKVLQISNPIPGSGSSVPEPASLALLGTGLLGTGGFLRRKIRG